MRKRRSPDNWKIGYPGRSCSIIYPLNYTKLFFCTIPYAHGGAPWRPDRPARACALGTDLPIRRKVQKKRYCSIRPLISATERRYSPRASLVNTYALR